MKKTLLILFTAIAAGVQAQKAATCDPLLKNLSFNGAGGGPVNMGQLETGRPVNMKFILANGNTENAVPAGSCFLSIALGSKLSLATSMLPGDELPLDRYFDWSLQRTAAGHYTLNGDLKKDLPAGFSGEVAFALLPQAEGSSTMSCQVLVSNHRNDIILADMQAGNNVVYSAYNIIKGLDIKFTQLKATPLSCSLDLNWAVAGEEGVARYTIETSTDGIAFSPAKQVIATGSQAYISLLEGLASRPVWVRIKAEDATGRFVYSETVNVNVFCKNRLEVAVYPNPVASEITELTLQAQSGLFNGRYTAVLLGAGGGELKRSELNGTNQSQFKFNTGFIAAGTYYIKLTGEDGEVSSLKVVKQ